MKILENFINKTWPIKEEAKSNIEAYNKLIQNPTTIQYFWYEINYSSILDHQIEIPREGDFINGIKIQTTKRIAQISLSVQGIVFYHLNPIKREWYFNNISSVTATFSQIKLILDIVNCFRQKDIKIYIHYGIAYLNRKDLFQSFRSQIGKKIIIYTGGQCYQLLENKYNKKIQSLKYFCKKTIFENHIDYENEILPDEVISYLQYTFL